MQQPEADPLTVGTAAPAGTVVVVGTVNRDLVLRLRTLPLPGQTLLATGLRTGPGGKGGNQAVAAAGTGCPTLLLAAVGDDDGGHATRQELSIAGVDVSRLSTVPAPTGTAVVMVADDGENSIVVAPGANALLDPAGVAQALRDLPPGVCLCSAEVSDEVVDAALSTARTAGWTVIYNAAPSRPLTPAQRAARPLLVVNQTEASDLAAGAAPKVAGVRLHAELGAPVVVTLGGDGALLIDGPRPADGPLRTDGTDGTTLIPAPAAEVVDTTGAGDAFCGVLAAGLAAGMTLDAAVVRACAAGSLATSWPGARRPADWAIGPPEGPITQELGIRT